MQRKFLSFVVICPMVRNRITIAISTNTLDLVFPSFFLVLVQVTRTRWCSTKYWARFPTDLAMTLEESSIDHTSVGVKRLRRSMMVRNFPRTIGYHRALSVYMCSFVNARAIDEKRSYLDIIVLTTTDITGLAIFRMEGLSGGWGDTHIKRRGVLVGDFEKNHLEEERSCFVGVAW